MLLDSNVLIRYFNGESKIIEQLRTWRIDGRIFVISSITTAETLSLKRLSVKDIQEIKEFLQTFVSVPFDDKIAQSAAYFRRTYNLEIPDAGIAATAKTLRLPLVTQDQQFKKIKEITVVEL
jgi:predicted nucleic acid-binding protein